MRTSHARKRSGSRNRSNRRYAPNSDLRTNNTVREWNSLPAQSFKMASHHADFVYFDARGRDRRARRYACPSDLTFPIPAVCGLSRPCWWKIQTANRRRSAPWPFACISPHHAAPLAKHL
jgi:hypothetical protein